MISFSNSLGRKLPCLLAMLIVCVLPVVVDAQTVIFRNELKIPVVVQTATVVGGVLRRDHTCLVRPGESTPKLKVNTDKVVTIFHGKSSQKLFQNVLKASKTNLFYGIVVEPGVPGRPARVNVIQRMMPAGLAGNPGMPKR